MVLRLFTDDLTSYTASPSIIRTLYNKLENMWKEAILSDVKLFQYFPIRSKKNHEIFIIPVPMSRFQPVKSCIQRTDNVRIEPHQKVWNIP